MNLELHGVADAGDLKKERVILRATADTDTAFFAIFQCLSAPDDDVFVGPITNVYWFASRSVKKGDWVVLYSKAGSPSEKGGENASPSSYFFYWNCHEPLWVEDMVPVLVETPDWTIKSNAPPKRARSAR